MQLLRRVIFWCHLVAGVVAGVVILIMSVTGVLLTYEKQMVAWADTRPSASRRRAGALRSRLTRSLAAVAARRTARGAHDDHACAIRRAPPVAWRPGRGRIYVNPYTGQVLGEGVAQPRGVLPEDDRLASLARRSPARGARPARAITGACNLAFLFLVVSGFYLWLPQQLDVAAVPRRRPGSGAACAARRATSTGTTRSASGARPAVRRRAQRRRDLVSVGERSRRIASRAKRRPRAPPAAPAARRRAAGGGPRAAGGRGSAAPAAELWTRLWPRAERRSTAGAASALRMPAADGEHRRVHDRPRHRRPAAEARHADAEHARPAEVVKWEPFASLSAGPPVAVVPALRAHRRSVGLAGQTIAGLASLGGAVLVYTGIALAIRRLWAWRARRSAAVRSAMAA